jgi:hypothetical protein
MRYGVNFAADGTPLPPTFHIPVTLAAYPYVPHPLMLAGIMPVMPVMGAHPPIPQGPAVTIMKALNS